MSRLVVTPNLADADGFYAALVQAHEEIGDEASQLMNARLVLLLANHVGDAEVLAEALRLARGPGATPSPAARIEDPR